MRRKNKERNQPNELDQQYDNDLCDAETATLPTHIFVLEKPESRM
jgi:hypothetical protein